MIKVWPGVGLILLAFPALEIWFAIMAAHWFGVQACFLWWIASFLLGLLILRTQRLALKTQMLMLASGQRNALAAVLWMARRTLAAILLLLPGFLSDAIAIVLLLPWPMPRSLRGQPGGQMPPGFDANFEFRRPGAADAAASSDIIDGEYRREDSPPASLPPQERS